MADADPDATTPTPRPASPFPRLLFAASLPGAGIAVCTPFAAWGWFPDLCLHLSFSASLALLPALIAVRRTPVRAGFLIAAMLLGCWPWVRAGYAPRAPLPATRTLHLATANLYDFNPRRETALATVLALDVDLLAVQEVLPADEPVLAARWPHVVWSRERKLFASALLSRLPLRDARVHALEEYALIEAVATTSAGPLRVFVVHLASPKRPERAAMRARQLDTLIPLIRASAEPVVIAGDFNLSVAAPAWVSFTGQTGLVRPPGISPATWPRWLGPLGIDLDHLAGRGLAMSPVSTFAIPGSDHLGLRCAVSVIAP